MDNTDDMDDTDGKDGKDGKDDEDRNRDMPNMVCNTDTNKDPSHNNRCMASRSRILSRNRRRVQ